MKTLSLVFGSMLIAGLLLAQGPRLRQGGPGADGAPQGDRGKGKGGPGRPQGFGGPGVFAGPNVENRLTRALNLNAEQQNALHAAIEDEKVQLKGLPEKERDLRDQLGAAIRAGDEGRIDQVTRDLAQVDQQRQATNAKLLARVYKSLDASQKGTLERVMGRQLGLRPQGPKSPAVTQ